MSFFDPKIPSGREYFTNDFARQMAAGLTISSAVCVVTWLGGTADLNASAMVSGAAVINGTKVSQLLIGGIDGARYQVEFDATLSDGQVIPEIHNLWVRAS